MKLFIFGVAILGVLWVVDVKLDRDTLNEGLIRMHIVANSDSQEDQSLKLQVRDAVTAYLTPILENMPSREEAEAYLREQDRENNRSAERHAPVQARISWEPEP